MGKYNDGAGSNPGAGNVYPPLTEREREVEIEAELDWYIVTCEDGHCNIISVEEGQPPPDRNTKERCVWGPFRSHDGAIARRIGLIRSGKCKPH